MIKVRANLDPGIFYDRDTLCPVDKYNVEIIITKESQVDGSPWSDDYIQLREIDLVHDILEKLRPQLEQMVKKTDPFKSWRDTVK